MQGNINLECHYSTTPNLILQTTFPPKIPPKQCPLLPTPPSTLPPQVSSSNATSTQHSSPQPKIQLRHHPNPKKRCVRRSTGASALRWYWAAGSNWRGIVVCMGRCVDLFFFFFVFRFFFFFFLFFFFSIFKGNYLRRCGLAFMSVWVGL